jgi:1,4-alpha-glucan branching enzyme
MWKLKTSVPAKAGAAGSIKITFALSLEDAPDEVSVVGDFNGWDPLKHPLKKRSNGMRSASVDLEGSDRVEFKYLDTHGNWFTDPDAAEVDNNGVSNSVIELG